MDLSIADAVDMFGAGAGLYRSPLMKGLILEPLGVQVIK
jgi:hypothetical protein